ncbi:MAG: 23S rRNA (pseudouridine(1915)-N(3))-methyltransferase RlmH [Methanoregula sp.]|nr:23S rRNA (pseudouridine(1915)-N(3))-methyltransferase RlmH [Methanoregula sp.]
MQIRILAVGKIKETYLRDGIAEYEKRLRPYVKIQIIEIADEKRALHPSAAQEELIKEREGECILAAIPPETYVVVLDVHGCLKSSKELAAHIHNWEIAGKNNIVMIIGGDLGLSPEVISQAHMRISISPMTFTHQMVRMILLEQIYRAYKINHHEPYHK